MILNYRRMRYDTLRTFVRLPLQEYQTAIQGQAMLPIA